MSISIVPIVTAIISSIIVALDLRKHPQPIKVVNIIWVVSMLWSSLLGLAVYFCIGRSRSIAKSGHGDSCTTSIGEKVLLSTFHCGAGCTVADLLGALFLVVCPITIIVSSVAGRWLFNYILSLLFGLYFQYNTIRHIGGISRSDAFKRAAIVNICSLTVWKVGVYTWLYIAIYKLHFIESYSLDSWAFWFILQQAVTIGFLVALPVNLLLIRLKIKPMINDK